jgi:hypothetical protein
MRLELLALYGGPDQVMTVTSGLASVLGLLLLFWNKVVGIFFKIIRRFHRSDTPAIPEISKDAPKRTLWSRVLFLAQKSYRIKRSNPIF